MSDSKFKLPDLQEITKMATKFYTDMKKSVCEIMADYKGKSAGEEKKEETAKPKTTKRAKPKSTETDNK